MFMRSAFILPLLATVVHGAGMFGFLNKGSHEATHADDVQATIAEESIGTERQEQQESLVGIYIIKSSGKPNLCIDDMDSHTPGEGNFHLWECNEYNINQHLTYDAASQQLRNPHKNLCVDDGGAFEPGQALLTYWHCDPGNINQRFEFNSAENMFYNPHKNLCLDDGGGFYPGDSKFHMWECSGNTNQRFEMERL